MRMPTQLGSGPANWVEIEEPAAMRLERGCGCGCGFFVAMGGEVVQNHFCAGRDLGDQDFADICSECRTVYCRRAHAEHAAERHCSLDDPGGNKGVVAQVYDEGLRTPAAEGRIRCQAFAARPPPAQSGEVGCGRCFVHCPAMDEREGKQHDPASQL